MVAGIALLAYLSFQFSSFLQKREYQVGQVAFDKAYVITYEKLNTYFLGLQSMGGFYLGKDYAIIPKEVREYAKFRNFFTNFPGVLGFGFIRYVRKEDFSSYEKQVQKKYPELIITRLTNKSFDDYMIIESIEPLELNRSALGLDIGSEPLRRDAAMKAMESGQATLTGQIQLVQIQNAEPGFLFFLPLYRSHTVPKNIEDRKKEIVGWSYSPILASSIGHHLSERFDPGLDFSILDEDGIIQNKRIFGTLADVTPTYSRTLEFGGRHWTLNANFKNIEFPGYIWILPVLAFLFFSAFYIVVCVYVWKLQNINVATERRAQLVEQHMAALVNSTSFAIIAVNTEGIITTANKAAIQMLGYSKEELLSGITPEIFHEPAEVKARALQLSRELKREISPDVSVFFANPTQGEVDVKEWTYIRKDQSRFPVRLVITSILNKEQQIEGYVGIAEDITELLEMRKTIDAQQQKMIASAKLSSLGEMAGGIAHEINNPLTIIISKIKIIENKIERNEMSWESLSVELGKIDHTTMRIAKIVRGLKAFSRESTKDPKELVKISGVLNDSLDLCAEKFKHYAIDLRLKDYEDFEFHCRPTQISQVLINLLNNAFDAIQTLEEKWIAIEVQKIDSKVRIAVTDSGGGIPSAIVEKLMHPFFTTKDVGKGTGLGLSISKGLIEDHGGSFYYDSVSINTRFVIELPI